MTAEDDREPARNEAMRRRTLLWIGALVLALVAVRLLVDRPTEGRGPGPAGRDGLPRRRLPQGRRRRAEARPGAAGRRPGAVPGRAPDPRRRLVRGPQGGHARRPGRLRGPRLRRRRAPVPARPHGDLPRPAPRRQGGRPLDQGARPGVRRRPRPRRRRRHLGRGAPGAAARPDRPRRRPGGGCARRFPRCQGPRGRQHQRPDRPGGRRLAPAAKDAIPAFLGDAPERRRGPRR